MYIVLVGCDLSQRGTLVPLILLLTLLNELDVVVDTLDGVVHLEDVV